MMRVVTLLAVAAAISEPATARLAEKDWTFQEMFAKSDLVVIAVPVSSKDTDEHSTLRDISPPESVLGLTTQFEVRLVVKGDMKIKTFVLHHYRLEHDEAMVSGPALVTFNSKQSTPFLLFLIREADGRYAPVTGQTDPGYYSVVELNTKSE
jgi:hypothetical protein